MSGNSEIVRICLQRGGSVQGCYNDGVNPPKDIIITPSFGPDGQVLAHAATGKDGIDIGLIYQDVEGNKLAGLDPAFISLGACSASNEGAEQTLADILVELEGIFTNLEGVFTNLGGDGLNPNVPELIQDVVDQLRNSRDFEESILCDDNDQTFVRIREYDAATQAFLPVRFETLTGAAYTPVGTVRPCFRDREVNKTCWVETATGDRLEQVDFIDTNDGTIAFSVWRNLTTGAVLAAAPAIADIEPCPEFEQILAALADLQELCTKLVDGPDGTGGIDSIVDALQAIQLRLEGDKDHERDLWTDDTGAVYYRVVEYDQETNTYTTSYELEDGTAYTPGANPVPYGGDGIDLAPVVTELQNILAQLQGDIDFEESVWCDDTDNTFIRIREFDNQTNAYLAPRFELPDGTAYTPTGAPKPCAANSDREFRENDWVAVADGTGYSEGNSITQVDIVDTETGVVTGTLWYNATTGAYIDPAPAQADLAPATELPELLETKQCVYNCDGGAIVELREIVVSVGGLIQGHDATAYTTADYPDFVGDGSGNVRSYYQALDGTNIAAADRPASVSCDPTCGREMGCITEPDGSKTEGYRICGSIEDPGIDPPPVVINFASIVSENFDPQQGNWPDRPISGTIAGVLGTVNVLPNDGNYEVTYQLASPENDITEILFQNNGGNSHYGDDWKSADIEVLDSGGAVIWTKTGHIFSVPTPNPAFPSPFAPFPIESIPVGLMQDVFQVRFFNMDGGGGAQSALLEPDALSQANTGNVQWQYVGLTKDEPEPPAFGCSVFTQDGTANTTGSFACGCCPTSVAPGIPQLLTAGATWSPPVGTTEVQWKSTGTGNTMATAAGTGPLGEGSGSIANGANESIDWSSVVFTAGAAPDELCITYKVTVTV